jgi:hypothetical protein
MWSNPVTHTPRLTRIWMQQVRAATVAVSVCALSCHSILIPFLLSLRSDTAAWPPYGIRVAVAAAAGHALGDCVVSPAVVGSGHSQAHSASDPASMASEHFFSRKEEIVLTQSSYRKTQTKKEITSNSFF